MMNKQSLIVDEIGSSLTSDLFGIEPCPNCDGSGQIESIEEERIEDYFVNSGALFFKVHTNEDVVDMFAKYFGGNW